MNEASDVTGCLVSGSPIGVGLDLLELLQFLILIFSTPVQIEFFFQRGIVPALRLTLSDTLI